MGWASHGDCKGGLADAEPQSPVKTSRAAIEPLLAWKGVRLVSFGDAGRRRTNKYKLCGKSFVQLADCPSFLIQTLGRGLESKDLDWDTWAVNLLAEKNIKVE